MRSFRTCTLFLLCLLAARGQERDPLLAGVELEVSTPRQEGALLHWKITNTLDYAVYAYSFYLWGPPYSVQRTEGHAFIDTTPVRQDPSCPPNRFPPVLLLVIGPHRTIEGDLTDSEIKDIASGGVSMRVAIGTDPYSVVKQAKSFARSNCKHSPYDAIVRWGRIIESNRLSAGALRTGAKHFGSPAAVHTSENHLSAEQLATVR